MPRAQEPKVPSEFGKRLLHACAEERRSPTSIEREAGISKGYLSRMIYGDRGQTSKDPLKVQALARALHVQFEWLFLGSGPMRRGGRDTTPAEQAITSARTFGAREDAIQAAWTRNKDREAIMTVWDWIEAIKGEVEMLERAAVPRPEKIQEHNETFKRQKNKLDKLRGKNAEKSEPMVKPAAHRRAIGDD